jgi:hypothetical protein
MKDPKAIRKAIMTAKSIASLIDPKFARVPLPDIGLPAPDMVVPEHSTTVHSAYDVPMPQKYAAGGDVEGRDYASPDDLGLYSHAAVTAASLPQAKASPDEFRNMLTNRGVKPAEFQWSGYDDAFADQPQVTREQVAAHFHENKPPVGQKVFQEGPLKEDMEALEKEHNRRWNEHRRQMHEALAEGREFDPDSEQYIQISRDRASAREALKDKYQKPYHEDYMLPGGENYREVLLKHDGSDSNFAGNQNHFRGEPDILAHLLMKDRTDTEGKKVLHLDELQSDWAQQGRKAGFRSEDSKSIINQYDDYRHSIKDIALDRVSKRAKEAGMSEQDTSDTLEHIMRTISPERLAFYAGGNEEVEKHNRLRDQAQEAKKGVDAAPYVTNTNDWVDLGLKRALLEAAKGGHDKLALTPGDVAADRYDLSKHVAKIEYLKQPNSDNGYLLAHGHHRANLLSQFVDDKDLPGIIGKDVAEKLIATTPTKKEGDELHRHTLEGLDLKVGGEGMRKFYDEMVPKRLMRLAKMHDPDVKFSKSTVSETPDDDILDEGMEDRLHHLPAIEITPRMRESILKKGFAAYAAGGEVEFPDYASTSGDGIDREGNRSAFLEGNHPLVPDVVYHGTDRDISQFDTEQPRRVDAGMDAYNTDTGWYGKGHYFTPHKRAASGFASDYRVGEGGGPNVMPVHLSLKNPFIVKVPQNSSGATDMDRAMDEAGFPKTSDERLLSKGRGERRPSEQTQMLMERGHDGVIVMQQFGFKDRDEEKAAEARKEAAWKRHLAAQDAYYEAPFENAHNGAEIKSIKDEFIKTRHEYHAAKEAAGGEYKPHELVVFKPHQVKSAIGNSGQYDPSEADITKAAGGDVEGYASGGDIDPEKFREHLKRIYSPLSEDPEIVRKALQIAGSYRAPIGMETGVGSLYTVKQSMPASAVTRTIQDIPGINLKPKVKGSWEDFYDLAKGNEFVNVGGDLSGFGRLTHINGKELAWPVDLHAGADYMREPNPGRVWANIGAHATGFQTKIREANERGKELYGILSPMGPSAVNSSHNMFDTLMAQIPNAEIDSEHIKEFDDAIKRGDHLNPKIKRNPKLFASYLKKLEKWPGLEDAKEVSEFARPWRGNLTGAHRADIVKFMDKGYWRDRGFPEVGVTRAAITNPDLMGAGGNKLGYRAVKLSAEPTKDDKSIFKHSTYPVDTFGEYVMDVPLVQRHYAQPDVIERLIKSPTKAGQIVHPYSEDPMGRSTARKLFEEQKQLQPVNQRFLDSVMTGMENQEKYGFKAGGSVRKALMIAKGVKKK